MLSRGLLTPRRRVGLFVAFASLGCIILTHDHVLPDLPMVAFLTHAAAAGALLWVAAAELLRRVGTPDSDDAMVRQSADALDRVAVLCGASAFVLLVFEMTLAVMLRVGLWSTGSRLFETSTAGLVDLAALIIAVCLSSSVRKQITPLLWLVVAAVVWLGLMIPAGLGSKSVVTSWPRWLPWTLCVFVGTSLVLFVSVVAQGMLHRRRRKLAWPDHLERLCEPHADWPGYRISAAVIAMGLLPIGAYHASSLLVMPCALMAGGAALWLAHRQWNTNFAEVGMALITLAITSFVVACVPEFVGGPELTTRMPILLAAAMIGLAMMIFIWQWLPNVWDQQLHDGVAWTTTGRMIPFARRTGVIVACFGVLAGSQLATWPMIASTLDRGPARLTIGILAYTILIGSMLVATRLSKRRSMAGLVLLCLALAGVYVAVRFPDIPFKYWFVERWPVAAALVAPILVGLSRLTRASRWQPFEEVLEASALVVFPVFAIAGTVSVSMDDAVSLRGIVIRYDAAMLRTVAWAILAGAYALSALLNGRRVLWSLTALLAIAAVANEILSK